MIDYPRSSFSRYRISQDNTIVKFDLTIKIFMKEPPPSPTFKVSEKSMLHFPSWHEVIDSLFKSDTFKAAGLNSESHVHFIDQINTLTKKYAFPVSEPDLMVMSFEASAQSKVGLTSLTEQEVIKQYQEQFAEKNQFNIVGDAQSMEFDYTDPKVVDLLDLPACKEFTLSRICGMDDTHELFHPEDVTHTIRQGLAILLTISVKGMFLNPFTDYYQIEFRMGFETPGRYKTINRICKLSNKRSTENGTRHVDLWTVYQGHHSFRHVQTKLVMLNRADLNLAINALYYITNCILLDITPRDALFANYLDRYGFKYYRQEINKECLQNQHLSHSQYTSAEGSNIKSNLLKKIDSRIVENTRKPTYKASIQKRSLHFKCGQLGILGMSNLVEKHIWKRAEKE